MKHRWIIILPAVALVVLSSVRSTTSAEITFNKHVAPLLWKNCASCHRPGEVAPFSLLTYRDASKRAGQIEEITQQRIMPPWKPVAGHGDFANARRLTPDELGLIHQWVAGGAIEGDAADLPAPPTFANDWQLGVPDLVVTLPQPVEVPSEGRDVYMNVILPFPVPEGKYIKAIEFRPGNRRVVHHAVLFYDVSGQARKLDAADPAIGFKAVTPPGRFLPGSLSIWTPGRRPVPLADGLSMAWPKEADLILNLHLHPSGKPETEQSSMGFYFTDEPPQRILFDLILIDRKIDIAPGDKAYRTTDSCVLPIDMDAISIFPHMHMIGKQFKLTATLPDGTDRPLLLIDDWDFNWQDIYRYAEPVRLPKGTKVTLEGIHDNSADNPHNPKNPPEQVRWGEQTFNEMTIAFVNLVPAGDADLTALRTAKMHRLMPAIVPASMMAAFAAAKPPSKGMDSKAAAPKETAAAGDPARDASVAIQKADKNGDGKLSIEEIVAAVGARHTPEEIAKIVDQFDRDGDKLLNPSEVAEVIKVLVKR